MVASFPRSGLTLVELLAVMVLLALAMVLLGPGVLRRLQRDPLAAAVAGIQSFDQQARLHAQGRGAVIHLDATSLSCPGIAGTAPVLHLPHGITATWRLASGGSDLAIDARGRSVDADLILEQETVRHRYRLHGLPGVLLPIEDARP